VFDKAKLGWVNGQHLRALPAAQAAALLGEAWASAGLIGAGGAAGAFVERAAALVAPSCELVADGVDQLRGMLGYPLAAEAADEKAAPVLADGFADVAASVLASYESGALAAAVAGGPDGWKAYVKDAGKALGRKGKGLFMPLRLALTGCLHGPDIGEQLALIEAASAPGVPVCFGCCAPGVIHIIDELLLPPAK
jgi:glutamyl-tRNA synthetase